ncbi:MAG TPA: hypothetical protein VE010_18215 [Thermoanaerobaculia bacterium]|nr:hypothetical protein [Thermoanaerobaculia bacterium]
MRDSFDYGTYWSLLARISQTHRLVRFAEFREGKDVEAPFCILRHDVDYSPRAALRMAEQEAERGIRATYFLLTGTSYYTLLAPEHAHVAKTLVALGHEVGLHYDVNTFTPFAREEWPRILRAQAALLSELAGAPVVSMAMHQPALNGDDPFRGEDHGFVNAYDDRFTREATYVSDSCRAWRNSGWSMFARGTFPPRLHLCLHPINWADEDRDRMTIFRDVHDELASSLATMRDELLEKIACHSGVLEHDARGGES